MTGNWLAERQRRAQIRVLPLRSAGSSPSHLLSSAADTTLITIPRYTLQKHPRHCSHLQPFILGFSRVWDSRASESLPRLLILKDTRTASSHHHRIPPSITFRPAPLLIHYPKINTHLQPLVLSPTRRHNAGHREGRPSRHGQAAETPAFRIYGSSCPGPNVCHHHHIALPLLHLAESQTFTLANQPPTAMSCRPFGAR